MNIIEQEDIIKGLPDDALQREARMPSGQVPQFLVVSEIQRRTDMRKRFEANQPQQNMSVADQVVQEGIGAVQPTMMAEGGRTPFTEKYANGGGVVGTQFPLIADTLIRNLTLDPYGNPVNIDPSTDAEFIPYNYGRDVGIGIPIYQSYRQKDLGPVPPSMAEGNRAALENIGKGIQSLTLQREATDQPSGARNMISQFYNEDPFTGLVDPDNKNPLAAALLGGNVNLGTTDQKVADLLSGLFPENDPTQPSRRQRRMDDSPLGDFGESYVAAFGSDPNLRTGRSARRAVQGSDVLNPLDGITFAATSDTPRGDDTPTALTSAQILSNARENIENAKNLQNVSSAELLAQIQPNQTDKTATDFEAPTVVDDPVTNAEKLLDEINPNIGTTVITGPTVADAAKTDPVSIAAKQYADLLGGEKNDKMRNAMMLASLGAGIAKGDTAGGLQQAANVAASYQQKEIDRAEKDLDRAIKRADTEAMQDLKRQEVEGRIGYYDVLKLNAQNEQTRLAQAADLKAEERDASYRQTATRILNQGLEQALKNVPKYKTMTAAQQAAVRRNILNQTADVTLRYEGSAYAPFLDQLINSMAGATDGKSLSSRYKVLEKR